MILSVLWADRSASADILLGSRMVNRLPAPGLVFQNGIFVDRGLVHAVHLGRNSLQIGGKTALAGRVPPWPGDDLQKNCSAQSSDLNVG